MCQFFIDAWGRAPTSVRAIPRHASLRRLDRNPCLSLTPRVDATLMAKRVYSYSHIVGMEDIMGDKGRKNIEKLKKEKTKGTTGAATPTPPVSDPQKR